VGYFGWFSGKGLVMKLDDGENKRNSILTHLSVLPQKILSLHGRDDLAEFVLRDLCHERCFNLKKAAFFVDNPDFNHLKGVAGFSHEENPTVCDLLWEHPEDFMVRIKESPFNQKVRDLWLPSLQVVQESEQEVIQSVAQLLGINKPLSCSCAVKHGNHGILVFEKENQNNTAADEHVTHGVSLLGFCPVY